MARPPARGPRKAAPGTLVLLVRHGATPTTGALLPGRARGLHLAPAGREQARAVAERMAALAGAGRRISAVYASPLERARETAGPIAQALGLSVATHRGLLECDFGEWTGRELKELRRLPEWRAVQAHPAGFRFPGGESFLEMQARILAAVDGLRREHAGEAVVAVSHADPIKAVLSHALGAHLDLFQRIVVAPCSVSAVLYGAEGPVVLTVNHTADLACLAPS